MQIKNMAGAATLLTFVALAPCCASAAEKNWTAPSGKIVGQVLADATMAAHPELLSVTLHGIPPGMTNVYTMFAGSYHDRIGNGDDPDDIDVQTKGITIVDPRWHRTQDLQKKFVVQTPLRDASGTNIGLIVYAFKNDNPGAGDEIKYYEAALAMRDALEKQIPSYATLYMPAK